LHFFEEAVASLHVYKDKSWALNCYKLVFLAKDAQLASWVQLEVITHASDDLNRRRVCSQAFKSKLNSLTGTECFLDEV
jgi:hypothetical protein